MNEINPKITNINKISSVEPDIKQKKSSQQGDTSFNDILTNQINKSSNDTGFKENTSLGEIKASFAAQRLTLELNQTQFTQKLETSLDLLDTYAALLQDPDKTLKQAHGLLEQIIDQTKALDREAKENPDFSHDLKDILTQLLTTAQVEQIKFNRGDYL